MGWFNTGTGSDGHPSTTPGTSEDASNATGATPFNPDPDRVRKVFAEFRVAVQRDAQERRYVEPEPPPAEVGGRI